MNQEQNNLNPNNFNIQGNKGMSNNEPLQNNQSFNTTINQNVIPNTNVNQHSMAEPIPQVQANPTPSFQQTVIQEPVQQPINNISEDTNTNNQNFNSKPPKKMNLGLIIGIVVVVIVILVGFFIVFNNKNTDEVNIPKNIESEYEQELKVYDVYREYQYHENASTLTFTYNGQTLIYPFTINDIQNLGITIDSEDLIEYSQLQAGRSVFSNITGYTDSNDEIINFGVFNDSNNVLDLQNCVVYYILTKNRKVTINGITPGKSKYEDILELFGRDDQKRKNTFYNENLRQKKEEDFDPHMYYNIETKEGKNCNFDVILDETIDNDALIDVVDGIEYHILGM